MIVGYRNAAHFSFISETHWRKPQSLSETQIGGAATAPLDIRTPSYPIHDSDAGLLATPHIWSALNEPRSFGPEQTDGHIAGVAQFYHFHAVDHPPVIALATQSIGNARP